MKTLRIALAATLTAGALWGEASPALGQTTYTWNNTGTAFATPANWSPTGPPGSIDTAQFNVLGTFGTGPINNPTISSPATTITQLSLSNTATFQGWTLSGTGALTAGTGGSSGLYARGVGTYTIDLGNGTATSLTLTGPTGNTGGAMNVGTSSTVVLTGNTVANTGSVVNSIRGGTLVLDNSAGNPAIQRLTAAGGFNLNGGGSTLELRGAAAGTTFGSLTGPLGGAGGGDTYLRTVQNGSGALAVSFASLSRLNTSGTHFFENIGTGFVGDAGKPTVTFTTAPQTRQGVLSTSATTTIPWAVVTSRSSATSNDVTGRWANYDTGVKAAVTTTFTGDFNTATAGTNVLFTGPATANQTVNLSTVTTNQLATVVFEPQAAGTTVNVGTGQMNTLGVLLSGTRDLTVTGGSLFSTGTLGTRVLAVVNPTTALTTNSNLAASNSPVTVSGPGFVVLTGTGNQVAFSTSQNFNLGGGTLRVTSTNFNLTPATAPTLRFRGGVIEYDVSGGNFTFNRPLGTGAGNVNWNGNTGGAATNVGGGGFSAYSTDPTKALTVNIGGAGATMTWNSATDLFVADGYALKFGSTRSNATVVWQNPVALDGGSVGNYLAREINVTRGVGNAADRTLMTGIISGSTSTDLIKTGTGVLDLTSLNTYQGNTLVAGGTLSVGGTLGTPSVEKTGSVVVNAGATLGGAGTVYQDTSGAGTARVRTGGTVTAGQAGDADLDLQLGSGGLALETDATYLVKLFGTGTADISKLNVTGAVALDAGAKLALDLSALSPAQVTALRAAVGFGNTRTYTVLAATGGVGNFATGNFSVSNLGNFAAGEWALVASPAANTVQLSFTPVPEPATALGIAAAALGVGGFARRKLRQAIAEA